MRVAVGYDHRGYAACSGVCKAIEDLGHTAILVGSSDGKTVDYPDVAIDVASMVSRGEADRAILLAASGMGMCIAANKLPGVRAAACVDDWMATMSRQSFDVNVLCLSAEMLRDDQIACILAVWMTTEFEGGRHLRRLEKILAAERALLRQAPQA